jgi:hypothetical protein
MRAEYIEMRKTKNYNLNWFYKYYYQEYEKLKDEKGFGPMISPEVFYHLFKQLLTFEPHSILDYLDGVFEVQIILDKNGKEI